VQTVGAILQLLSNFNFLKLNFNALKLSGMLRVKAWPKDIPVEIMWE